MKDVTHIERSNLPWHDEHVTECGLDADRHPTWTRAEAVAIARQFGKQRFAMVCCMTCLNTAERHRTWDEDPVSCMDRYTNRWGYGGRDGDAGQFANELRAIALLIEAHREEFDATVADLAATESIAARRAARRRVGP